ncbi:MAG: flagellar hook-length control protein [Clostridiales bacterium]|jgi:flagellar hook-length control protein FliK|nr:flagellar hook-length control protein [Clostridiales bacterium]
MTNVSALNIKSAFLDIGSKNNVAGTNQTNFQDTLKNSVKKEDEPVTTKNKMDNAAQKTDSTRNQKVESPKKEISISKDVVNEEEEIRELEQLENKLVELVAKALGIGTKELEAIMDNLRLEPTELLNLENLQSLILAVTGNENMLHLLAQPKEVTMPITEMISEITALSAKESIQQIVQTESNISTTTQEKPVVLPEVKTVQDQNIVENAEVKMNTTEQETKNITTIVQDFEENVSQNSDQKENLKENKSGNTETTKTVMSSDELLSNLNKLSDNSLNVNRTENVEQPATTKYVEIVKQIVDQINVTIKANVTSMEMQLNPENLGKLNLVISSKDGVLKAQFTVTDQVVKEALESQMTQLKESLSQQGLKVESIEVKLSNLAYDLNQQRQQQGQQQQKKKSSFNLEDAQAAEEDRSFIEGIRKELEIERSTQVDFSA